MAFYLQGTEVNGSENKSVEIREIRVKNIFTLIALACALRASRRIDTDKIFKKNLTK